MHSRFISVIIVVSFLSNTVLAAVSETDSLTEYLVRVFGENIPTVID